MSQLARLLDVVRRELGADDARAEVGGKDPSDPRLVYCNLPGGWRLVAVFSEEPAERERLFERLHAIIDSFSVVAPSTDDWLNVSQELCARRLDDELAVLADRAGASCAFVIDAHSPVIWGSSAPRRADEDVDGALETARALGQAESAGMDLASLLEQDGEAARAALDQAGLEPRAATFLVRELERIRHDSRRSGSAWRQHLLACKAMAAVREAKHVAARSGSSSAEIVRESEWAYLKKRLADIYWVVLVFETRLSELHAEAAVVRAWPAIERLVLALPPVEPPPRPGKVVRLPKPER